MACSAVNWGLRSPYSDTNNAYYINTDGSVNNNNVYNANFAPRPALMEYRVQVPQGHELPVTGRAANGQPIAFGRKQRTIIKGGHILSSVGLWSEHRQTGDKHIAPTLAGSKTAVCRRSYLQGGRYCPLSATLTPCAAPSKPRMCDYEFHL